MFQIDYEADNKEIQVWKCLGNSNWNVTVFDTEDMSDLDNCKTFVLDMIDDMISEGG